MYQSIEMLDVSKRFLNFKEHRYFNVLAHWLSSNDMKMIIRKIDFFMKFD